MATNVFHLIYDFGDKRWWLEEDGDAIADFDTQSEAFIASHRCCRTMYEHGADARLVIHEKDGSVQREWSYEHHAQRSAA